MGSRGACPFPRRRATALLALLAALLAGALAPLPAGAAAPLTGLHYAPNANFGKGRHAATYEPGKDGFDLADVGTPEQLGSLPAGVQGLVYLGLCKGADSSFVATVEPFLGSPKLYGFYLMDEPDPTGRYAPRCLASDLKAEADWIHANAPGARTFIVLMNLGTPTSPEYMDTYNSANTDIELFGLDPYPCMKELKGCDYAVIGAAVAAAEAAGIETGQIVPVYQAFGATHGSYKPWTLPTAAQEEQILAAWGPLVPDPAFDFAYSWGRQSADRALEDSPDLRAVFAAHNA